MCFHRISLILLFFSCLAFSASDIKSPSSFGFSLPSTKSARNSIAMEPMAVEGVIDSSYKLGPGDYLDIMLEQDFFSLQILSDGSIAIEECGIVQIAGKTLAEAREEIVKVASKKYNPEYVFVQLSQMKKFVVSVMGAVKQVGQMVVDPQTRLSMALQKADNILGTGRKDDVWVIRKGDTLHINCVEIFDKGNFEQDILLEQGDRIYVPFMNTLDMIALIFPGGSRVGVPYDSSSTIAQYFEKAGGDRMHNMGYQSVTIRYPDKTTKVISAKELNHWKVPPQTEIEFSVKTLFVYVGGAVMAMGKIPYESSWHAIDYIAASGILTQTGTWSQVSVVRGDQEKIKVNVSTDQILPGDYIEIPKSRYETFKDVTMFLASLLSVISTAVVIYVNFK
jgi:protein involved in polysaccharide export with SLBB domain